MGEEQDVAVDRREPVDRPGPRARRDRASGLAARRAVAPEVPARPLGRGARPRCGPRRRRSPTPCRSSSSSGAGKPGERAPSRCARPSGLDSTSAKPRPASRSPAARACASPVVGERDVRCARCGGGSRLHSVSPWRTQVTVIRACAGSASSSPAACRRACGPCNASTRSWWNGDESDSAWPITCRRRDVELLLQPARQPQRAAQHRAVAHHRRVGGADVLDADRAVVEPDGVAAAQLQRDELVDGPVRVDQEVRADAGQLAELDVGALSANVL